MMLGNEVAGFHEKIQERCKVKFRGGLGPANSNDKSVRILSRIITWTEEGIRYEADQRHAEIIIRQLGLKGSSN